MGWVVFLRGVNVGGHKAFQPSALAMQLAHLNVVNVGAAGTFVIRKSISQAKVRAELCSQLAFEPEIMICTGRELLELAAADPFTKEAANEDVTRYVTILGKRPAALPEFPLLKPGGADWQVKVFAVKERFALSLHRRQGKRLIYPNEVIEKEFGVAATTRNWNTIVAIAEILRRD
ncbi:MAG TPA: DUF1697 domain-containing protein [Gemmataceae bacterium]|jgi:uncharacterized protein (DUF1697 family)|nr:DUF1697 domain-containing protein [Gemmataceae bacterium]